jgi:hypothetical protein
VAPVEEVRGIASRHGFGLVLAAEAQERLPLRDDAVVPA